jgi:hypothetical protein
MWWILGSVTTVAALVWVAYKYPTFFQFWLEKGKDTAAQVEDKINKQK